MYYLNEIVKHLSNLLWNGPLLIVLVATHLYLTLRLKGIQRYLPAALKLSFSKEEGADGNISQFAALATALASTIGTGNIIGMSTAIALGGPGAIFWTWITGFFGIATKYAEALLSVKHRVLKADGTYVGGPMYVMEKALNARWLGVIFAICTIMATLGTGGAVQSKAITAVVSNTFNLSPIFVGIAITFFVGLVILGGIKSISKVSTKLVPFMSIFYLGGCICLLSLCYDQIVPAFELIIQSAFTPKAATGAFIGSTIMTASRYGIARGLFSNESGLGTAPMAAASAQTLNPVRQALVSMSGVFWDTIVVCLLSGITIIAAALKYKNAFLNISDDAYAQVAFNQLHFGNLNNLGSWILAIALSIFAFTTIIGWAYYGETATAYVFGESAKLYYRVIFLSLVLWGSIASLDLIWNFADLFNGLMAFPNLISLLALRKEIIAETNYYLWQKRLHLPATIKEFKKH